MYMIPHPPPSLITVFVLHPSYLVCYIKSRQLLLFYPFINVINGEICSIEVEISHETEPFIQLVSVAPGLAATWASRKRHSVTRRAA